MNMMLFIDERSDPAIRRTDWLSDHCPRVSLRVGDISLTIDADGATAAEHLARELLSAVEAIRAEVKQREETVSAAHEGAVR